MPSITGIPLTPLMLQASSTVTITCAALGGPRLIISWYKGNQLISSGQIGETSLSYNIFNANVTNNGDYMCVAAVNEYQVNSAFINVLGT